MFARLVKNIEVAARTGGGDPDGNPTLYDAIQKAKRSSVPADNIERAVKRGSGETDDSVQYESITYEGYGPNGVAILIECLTDNRNRAASEVRVALSRNGGTLADPGSVAYLFNRRGIVEAPKGDNTEEDILLAVLDAGAEDVTETGDTFIIESDPKDVVAVRTALQEAGIEYDSAESKWVPSTEVPLDKAGAEKLLRLTDALDDLDDIQEVYTNADISDEIMEELDA
ncbi:DNA-binding regulatory protein, YebC/PmpR family [Actinobaculum suis]|nr:DNA-binding regulatory protein, YebC/PmpR family [Actinobaculum suis]